MKKLAFGLYVTVALFGLFGAIVLYNAPLDSQKLIDGYGVGTATTTDDNAAATAAVQLAK
jgi:hypothetical protein